MDRPIAPAASVVLVRGEPLEVFIVQRADALRFFGGFYAFPGGRVHASDTEAKVDATGKERWLVEEEHSFCIAAIRELFEETGVLYLREGRQRSLIAVSVYRVHDTPPDAPTDTRSPGPAPVCVTPTQPQQRL